MVLFDVLASQAFNHDAWRQRFSTLPIYQLSLPRVQIGKEVIKFFIFFIKPMKLLIGSYQEAGSGQ